MTHGLRFSPVLAALVSACAAAHLPKARPQSASSGADLIGHWRLISYEDWDSLGRRTTPYGEQPLGYIRYDADSTMAVQIMATPPRPAFAEGEDQGTAAEKVAAFDAYVAYFGRWVVNAEGQVTHRVTGALDPTYVGTDQERPFRVTGDSLILGDGRTWRRVFVRVR